MFTNLDPEFLRETYNERIAQARRDYGRRSVERKNVSLRTRVARALRAGLVVVGLR